ncbi:hypothetical protein [Streptomyces sp. NPDC048385]|uniref:arsenate reductase/protein-tyrosine-phosphatase family protein n=1 Tax=Streptomyces sp. NPDC048385 TaxID=3155145 RepID=UPI0034134F4D
MLLRHRAGDGIRVLTAGSEPGSEITPVLFRLLAEQGMNADEEFPKPLTHEVVTAADFVVTLGCGDACPVRPGAAIWTGTRRSWAAWISKARER